MEDSCGPTKPKRFLVDVKAGTSSSDAEEITGNVKQVDLPHLVVEKILENLKFEDLLQCSLVNKFWNHEARRLLREKHKCALIVDLDKPPADEIIKLKTTLEAAEWPLPYGSLSIRKQVMHLKSSEIISWIPAHRKLCKSAIKNIILRAGPFEIVHLDISCRCVVGAFVIKHLLAEVQKTVKVLIVKNLDGWVMFDNARILPELKKLEIDTYARISHRNLMRIQNFLQYSKKLETVGLMSSRWLMLLENIPEARKLAVVKKFTCYDMYIDQRRAAKFAELEPKLEKLYFWRPDHNPYTRIEIEETRSILIMSLLLSSRTSLIELQVPYEILEEIRRKKPFAVFENVRRLTVQASFGVHREGLERNQTIIALFPKLEALIPSYY